MQTKVCFTFADDSIDAFMTQSYEAQQCNWNTLLHLYGNNR